MSLASAMSFNQSFGVASIEKLRADGSNFITWSTQTQALFGARGVMRHVRGETIPPPTVAKYDPSTTYTAEELKVLQDTQSVMDRYKQQECIVKQQIFATIPNTLLLMVQSKATAADVWNAVQDEMKNRSEMY